MLEYGCGVLSQRRMPGCELHREGQQLLGEQAGHPKPARGQAGGTGTVLAILACPMQCSSAEPEKQLSWCFSDLDCNLARDSGHLLSPLWTESGGGLPQLH